MRRRYLLFGMIAAIAILAAGCAGTYEGGGNEPYDASPYSDVGYFYDDLAPYGMWVSVDPYGWVWCPLDTPFGWRPYTVGYWAYTNWGWMWMSDDPWGWTPYRYGRWTFDAYYGWIWIPGDVWAPAWVAWRYGGGWVGWAPLPPGAAWSPDAGLSYGPADLDQHIDRFGWSFLRDRDFGRTRRRVNVEPASRNVTLIGVTRNVTRYENENSIPVDRGVRRAEIERSIGHSIPEYRVVELQTPTRDRKTVFHGQEVEVYRPPVHVAERLRERLDATPPERRPVPPPRLLQRQERERQQIDQRAERQRKLLAQEHEREQKEPPPGVSTAELRKRQEAERRAQQELLQRQQQVLQERQQRVREQIQKREEDRARAAEEARQRNEERDRARQEQQQRERDRPQERNRGR
jgi:hypothetical protein